jgi:hypothetical protein
MPGSKPIDVFRGNAQFLESLTAHRGRFVIVGGVAVKYYIPNRESETNDLDLLIDPTEENALSVLGALNSGGMLGWDVTASDLAKPNNHVHVGCRAYLLDLLTPKSSTHFSQVWSEAADAKVFYTPALVPVRVAPVPTLIEMIALSEQPKHVRDRELLRRYLALGPA